MGNKIFLAIVFLLQFSCIMPSQQENKKMLMSYHELAQDDDKYNAFVTRMVKKHGSLDSILPSGQTLLHCVVKLNNPQFVDRLIRSGAKSTVPDKYGYTAYDYVATHEIRLIFLAEAIDFLL